MVGAREWWVARSIPCNQGEGPILYHVITHDEGERVIPKACFSYFPTITELSKGCLASCAAEEELREPRNYPACGCETEDTRGAAC
jgi:hypothetical protein